MLCIAQCFKITVASSQGSGGVGNHVSWMCRPWEEAGERPASYCIFIFQSHPSPGLSASFLHLYCSFPLPPLTLHISVKNEREQVLQVTQLIVFLLTGYVIGRFSLHPTMLFHSKIIFKGRKRKPTTTTHGRCSFTLAQLFVSIFWVINVLMIIFVFVFNVYNEIFICIFVFVVAIFSHQFINQANNSSKQTLEEPLPEGAQSNIVAGTTI